MLNQQSNIESTDSDLEQAKGKTIKSFVEESDSLLRISFTDGTNLRVKGYSDTSLNLQFYFNNGN